MTWVHGNGLFKLAGLHGDDGPGPGRGWVHGGGGGMGMRRALGTATGNLHHLYIVEVRATWASASGPGPTPVHWCWAHALSVQRCRKRRFAPSYLRCCKRFGDPSLLPIVSSEGISPKKEPFSNPNQPFDARNEGKLASEGRRNQKIPKTKPFRRKIQP